MSRAARIRAGLGAALPIVSIVIAVSGIWLTTVSQRDSRHATQLGLLSQLDADDSVMDQRVNATDVVERACDPAAEIPDRQQDMLRAVLSHYDYFAWLLETDQLASVQGVGPRWRSHLLEAEELGERAFSRDDLRDRYADLYRYARAVAPRDRPPSICVPD